MGRQPVSRTLIVGTASLVFMGCSILPLAYLATTVLREGAPPSLLALDARQQGLLFNTALLGASTALCATAIGAPLGLALARITVPRKALLRMLLVMPLLLPPYVVGLAWTYLGSTRGVAATLIGHDLVALWTYSLPAAVLVLSVVFYPLSMLATEVALRRIDGRLEEAAFIVAPPRRVLAHVTLPLALPGILAAALVIFVLAISEFGVPALLRVRVYTTEVFTAFAAFYDSNRAVLMATPLLLLSLTVAAAAALIGDHPFVTRRSSVAPPRTFDGWRGGATAAIVLAVALSVGLPIAVLAGEASRAPSMAGMLAGSGAAVANSLTLAAVGATLVVALAVWLGYARARLRGRSGLVTDVLFVVLFATPSTIVGIGLIGLWNRPGLPGLLYGTKGMLLLTYLARFVPVAALALAATARQVPVSHEEAAAVSGAGWLRTLWHVVLPQMRLGLGAVWTIVFVLAFGELGASILVAPPGESTLPIRIYTIIANTPSSTVAALALLQALVVFLPLAVLGSAVSRHIR
jgi:iron(III) transport system permease protein